MGVDRIDIRFQFPAPDRVTPRLLGLEWNDVALYQAGYNPVRIVADSAFPQRCARIR
jgi:hypothetical protein